MTIKSVILYTELLIDLQRVRETTKRENIRQLKTILLNTELSVDLQKYCSCDT
jgi:hypothetical protein